MSLSKIIEEMYMGYKFAYVLFFFAKTLPADLEKKSEMKEKKNSEMKEDLKYQLKPIYKTMHEARQFYENKSISGTAEYFAIGAMTYLVVHPLQTWKISQRFKNYEGEEMNIANFLE